MERTGVSLLMALFFMFVMATTFQSCLSAASQPSNKQKSTGKIAANDLLSTSAVFPIAGNVYPLGYYSVILNIGNPPKAYDLDIDTGSDLTWVQCDAPCTGCTKPAAQLYKPKQNIVPCSHSLCQTIHSSGKFPCEDPRDQCDYEVEYADFGSSLGVLLTDYFPLKLSNGSVLSPRLAFGCGYNQRNPGPHPPPPTSGILGLGRGKASIVSQLHGLGVMRNVIGHCLSRLGGGFLFFGDQLVPSRVTWTPMTRNSKDTHYSSGPAELIFDGKSTGIKGLEFVFDSGSSYTYFSAQFYQETLNLIRKNLNGKQLKEAPEDKTLPVCWKGAKPIKYVHDIKSFFKPLALSFVNGKNVQLRLVPEDYLIVSKERNVCLGILNGTQQGLGRLNVIGDIFLQEKMVIYDNEKQQIGWFPTNCDRLPKSVDRDYNEGFYEANFGIVEEHCPSDYASQPLIDIESFTTKNKRQK